MQRIYNDIILHYSPVFYNPLRETIPVFPTYIGSITVTATDSVGNQDLAYGASRLSSLVYTAEEVCSGSTRREQLFFSPDSKRSTMCQAD